MNLLILYILLLIVDMWGARLLLASFLRSGQAKHYVPAGPPWNAGHE